MRVLARLRLFCAMGLLAAGCSPCVQAQESLPKLPLVVLEVNFNADRTGFPPQGFTKEQLEAWKEGGMAWSRFPRRTYDALAWLTRTRFLTVEESAFGLNDKPVVLSFEDNRQPQYGPQVSFTLPDSVAKIGKRYLLTFDVAKNNYAQAGGFFIGDVAMVGFREEGAVVLNRSEIAHFSPGVPLHFEIGIDTLQKTATVTVDRNGARTITIPWVRPRGAFRVLRLEGLMPGGFARGKGKIAFDNIQLILEETL